MIPKHSVPWVPILFIGIVCKLQTLGSGASLGMGRNERKSGRSSQTILESWNEVLHHRL